MVNQIDFKVKIKISDIKIDTRLLVIKIFKEEMNIGVFVTQMFNNIQNFSRIHGMIMVEVGFKIKISKGQIVQMYIGTLRTKDLVEVKINFQQV